MYCVYVHTCPNGKIYVGMSGNLDNRWRDKFCYEPNAPFFSDIELYGWDNIKHEIICLVESFDRAQELEKMYIILKDAENPEHGYNRTSFKKRLENVYEMKQPYDKGANIQWETTAGGKNVFERKNCAVSRAKREIAEHIYNQRHRKIYERRYIDGLSYNKLSEEFGLSQRQLKRIVYKYDRMLEGTEDVS